MEFQRFHRDEYLRLPEKPGIYKFFNKEKAQGYAAAELASDTLIDLKPGTPNALKPSLVVGIGTGLGACVVVSREIVLATEAGHASLSMPDELRARLSLKPCMDCHLSRPGTSGLPSKRNFRPLTLNVCVKSPLPQRIRW